MNSFNFRYLVHRPMSGYYPGFRQASSIITFEFQMLDFNLKKENINIYFNSFVESLNRGRYALSFDETYEFFNFLELPLLLMQESGYPIFNEPLIISHNKKNQYIFLFPSIQHCHFIIIKIFEYSDKLINTIQNADEQVLEDLRKEFNDLLEKIKYTGPLGQNTLRFLSAANEMGVPWIRLYENVYQFGWGKNKRWLDSSFSDQTSNISAGLARHKSNTSFVLDLAGIPVAKGFVVKNKEELIRASEMLGFPLAIKPADLDGGVGVRASIKNQEQLIKAFDHAKMFSNIILVQEHVHGKDYRIQVFNNEAYWVVERQPCGVMGDGLHSISQLIDQENATRGRGKENDILVKIEIDEETIDLLNEEGLSLESIPPISSFIQLKRIANVARGGIPVPVLDKAHQDNLDLAIDAVKIVGLDIAGVDLICEDISISWKKSKSAICEINGQPALAKHLPKFLLEKMVTNKGRIPVIGFYGEVINSDQIKVWIKEYFPNSGWASIGHLNKTEISTKRVIKKTLYQNAMTLILDPTIECILLDIYPHENPIELPVDFMDTLFIGNFHKEINKQIQNTLDILINMTENYVNQNGTYKPKNISKEINLNLTSAEDVRGFLSQLSIKHNP